MAAERIPVVLDTDIGDDIDDLYALYLALFHPRLNLIAVTTAHGDTQAKARLVEKALRMAGRTDIPIGAGVGISVARLALGQISPDGWKAASYTSYVTDADPEANRTYRRASELILETLVRSPEPVAIVSIGAESNVAEAISVADESLRAKIKCIALMGGEVQAQMVEYNIICDPEAAEYVLNCGLEVFLGTFALTAKLKLTMDEVEAEYGSRATGVHETLYDCTKLWAPRGGKPGPVLYDLVPIFWLVDPTSVATRRSTVHVDLSSRYSRGQTVRTADGGNVHELIGLDADALTQECVRVIASGVSQ